MEEQKKIAGKEQARLQERLDIALGEKEKVVSERDELYWKLKESAGRVKTLKKRLRVAALEADTTVSALFTEWAENWLAKQGQ